MCRPRCLRRAHFAVKGQPDEDMPVATRDILAYVTRQQQVRDKLLPNLARTDTNVGRQDGKTPESDAEHLDFVLRESFEGRCAYQYIVDYCRSQAGFSQQLGAILERAGIKVECDETWLEKEELEAERIRFAESKLRVAWAVAASKRRNARAALDRYANHEPFFSHFATEREQAGQQALELMNLMHAPHAEVPSTDWFWFYDQHKDAFALYKSLVLRQARAQHPRQPVLAPEVLTQKLLFLEEVMSALLGVTPTHDLAGSHVFPDPFQLERKQVTWLAQRLDDFGTHKFPRTRQTYTDTSRKAWRGKIAKARLAPDHAKYKAIERKELVQFLNPALKLVGIVLRAWSPGKKKGKATAYLVRFVWQQPILQPTLEGGDEHIYPPDPQPRFRANDPPLPPPGSPEAPRRRRRATRPRRRRQPRPVG
jgi:hypothetical protein